VAEDTEGVIVIEPGRGGLWGALRESWQYRELLYFLAWRDIKVRYKQTVLGAAWAILQPLATMAVFTLVFNRVGGIRAPEGVPYPVFAFAGLLPWILFQSALLGSSASVVNEARLITKVYFPRLLVPFSAVVSGLVDFALSFAVLLAMIAVYAREPAYRGLLPSAAALLLPAFVLLAVLSALAAGVWFSALNAKYRDFRYVVPFLATLWMFLSPVAYSTADLAGKLPGAWGWLLGLNPMTGVLEGFRWALLGGALAAPGPLLLSAGVTAVVLVGGLFYFRRMERSFADLL